MSAEGTTGRGRVPRLIVGVGASAGGLEACKRLLAAMPHSTGIAFVIVMHLEPHRESHIAEIFAGSTNLHVVQAAGEQPLEPDCVYVIAPGAALEIDHGVLRTIEAREDGVRHPIDALLSSLAANQGPPAVGVILSGTGDDGSAGLRDIAARGGLCIVQEPSTAQFDPMPRNAIATGVARHVVSPEEMPRILLDYAGDPEALDQADAGSRSQDEASQVEPHGAFEGILDVLGRTYGVNFLGEYKRGTLQRRTERRMGLRRLTDWQAYLELLRNEPAEVAALYRDVLIGVTGFFRDPEVWDELATDVLPALLRDHEADIPLKIWVPGCATGEEAYSLAILVREQIEQLNSQVKLQIFATDVAEDALVVARRGRYPATIEEAVSPQRLARFFRRDGDSFQVSRDVRDCLTFAVHNLLADPPFSRVDLVSCRNVLIYLETHAQQRVLELFSFALAPGGLLVLGSSETVGQHGNLFETVSQKSRIYRSKAVAEHAWQHHPQREPKRASLRAAPSPPKPMPRGAKVSRRLEQIVLSRYTWACVAIDESFEIQSFFGRTQDYLVQPTGEARMNLFAWVKPGIYARLRTALEQVLTRKESVQVTDMHVERDGTVQRVECSIEPITLLPGETRMLLVVFRDAPCPPAAEVPEGADAPEPIVRQLEAELESARQELRVTVEQLESTNEEYQASYEELLSINEELQSSNEELESSKEELQSLNEELNTINGELEELNVELRTANADIKNLLVSTQIPVIFLDRDLRVRRFTPAATELMRLIPSDVGRSIEHVKERFDDDRMVSDARSVLNKLSPITAEVRTEDGRVYTRTVLPYRTDDDRIEGVCLTFHDITERKQAAQAVDEARVYAESIVETVQVPLIVLDEDMHVVSANARFYQTFHVNPRETEAAELYALGNRQWDIPSLRRLLEEVLPTSREVDDYEVEHEFEQIGRRVMRLNARRMGRNHRPDLVLLSIEDITEKLSAERVAARRADELAREHERKDEFLAMLGHELRNPLSAVMHGLDLLGHVADDRARAEQVRAMMRRQAIRIGNMLDQLLDIARLSAEKVRIAAEPVDLAEVIHAAVESTSPLLEAHGHDLSISLPSDEKVVVQGDLDRLTQVVENLLTNAAKYTHDHGSIELSLRCVQSTARLSVRDNGIGMEPELVPHVFELFTQAPRTLERAQGGLGLGLALVSRVVQMHGGTVEASSPGPGQGSEFVVTLPLAERRRPPEHTGDAPEADSAKTRSRRILVVDDEKDIAEMLAEILAIEGHELRTVYDGPSALEAAHTFAPDVVLLDLGLPGMDGYAVARQLRYEQPRDAILLIALTGYQEDAERLEQAGFDRHLIKPPDMQKLSAWLAAWGDTKDHRGRS